MSKKVITILGSTGSIGRQALEVVERNPDDLELYALVCNSQAALLAEQALKFRPKRVVINDVSRERDLSKALKGSGIEVLSGREAILETAASYNADLVVSALVGFAGLAPTLKALENGMQVALANKEALVVGGELVKKLCATHGGVILPVDSEHSAIFQCLMGESGNRVERIFLTASGGPFVDKPVSELASVTPEEALQHPTWSMGRKVTIDSATLMNKGLEMIEAHYLFDVHPSRIEVLVHRQSIVHSMVGFRDGSLKAQLSLPDMRLPIAFALLYPRRMAGFSELPSVRDLAKLTFEAPRIEDFPCLRIAYEALEMGGTAPCVMNAANEVAVERFLSGKIGFTEIPKIVEYVVERLGQRSGSSLQLLMDMDKEARAMAQAWYSGIGR